MNEIESLNIEGMSFEEAYEKLNEIVNKMENSEVSLDESIQYYEISNLSFLPRLKLLRNF